MSNLISMDKKYKTRDGRDVRVLCVDATELDDYPVIAIVNDVEKYTSDGKYYATQESKYDLIEQPEEKTVWLEIYRYEHWRDTDKDSIGYKFCERALQDYVETKKEDSKGYKLIAIKKITYVEGEGIE